MNICYLTDLWLWPVYHGAETIYLWRRNDISLGIHRQCKRIYILLSIQRTASRLCIQLIYRFTAMRYRLRRTLQVWYEFIRRLWLCLSMSFTNCLHVSKKGFHFNSNDQRFRHVINTDYTKYQTTTGYWPAHRAGLLFCNFFDMLTPVPYHHFFSSLILLFIYV